MGWRFRRSINVGFGFRINLSKSGIGYSWGFPGYRVTKMATGGTRTTYSLPGTGISYVEQTGKNNNREDMLYLGETKDYKNIPVSEIQKNDPILKKINNVMFFNRVSNFLILLSLGSYYNPIFIVNLILGLIIKLIIYTSNKIGIYYEFDEESREMYDSLKEVFIKLSNNKKMWQVNSATQVYNTKYNAGVARNMSGCSAFITTRIPWYIKTNIDIYGFNLRNEKLFFTPDRVIVFRPFRKAFGCSYEHMKLFVNSTKFVETRRVCSDAIVEDYTWRYANKDGGRDLRFTSNKKFPICKYGEFSIESPYGINTKIIFSNFNIAKDMKSDLLSFGDKCIDILTKEKKYAEEDEQGLEKYNEETEDDNIDLEKRKIKISSISELTHQNVEDVEETSKEIKYIDYILPSIDLIKDKESESILKIYESLMNEKNIMIPIGVSEEGMILEELNSMPNFLIGGTIMTGKSSYINSIISSILLTKNPYDIRFIIFDSKKVDYSIYNVIPHLLLPVLTDSKRLNVALDKVLLEIESRKELLSKNNVKNITQYNDSIIKKENKIPNILIIIDDLTNLNGIDEINDKIEKITLNGWNVNVFMIVSSNHPSAKVISTLSKSNFPSRLSFKVTNSQASQIIINEPGAEKLTELGSALYISRTTNKPIKVKVPFISDGDIKNIVEKWKEQNQNKYLNNNISKKENTIDFEDPLYNEIVEFVIKSGKASGSLLQRRFKLGYNRASQIIDLLEKRGIIGPANGVLPREVLVSLNEEDGE